MQHRSTVHEVLIAVFQVRSFAAGQAPELAVLLWQRALDPQKGSWSLPGGVLSDDEDLPTSARRQLAEKVDVRTVAHLEQLSVFSDPERVPGDRRIASNFLGLVPIVSDPRLPPDTAWHPVARLPETSFDHGTVVRHARNRLVAKLSYTNIGFALAPVEFAMSTLREIYTAALGYSVDATNLQRVLGRRKVIEPTGRTSPSGRTGGRPPALFRFAESSIRVTDEFAALRPPT
ncbi:NUDIX hydrolase [Rhodococcus sp. RS1C4]|uniref:NUDIX hydrolase n=1 Tax=Nocardiaceae TaxID=85025 RepID=UPI0003809078|nr:MULTISPECIES: NUDIX domain-containing protein [Rhodococcus]OZC47730.1 NUDIX hydrolase [Rhodococcus sp. RS1C4]OZC61481.1 NUDIX hydrolase [Rhodococcus sp. 06-621-2]OZD13263.1 NUDIX hydrolase [Rhodococcus sp. 06-156-4C]OZD16140.1 NUDIX hydrolase [Rhodococcus sp. 06-156-3C]OZD17494.1 NUDIX hydrolase [Rhodococcus sp. 06-156-4a]